MNMPKWLHCMIVTALRCVFCAAGLADEWHELLLTGFGRSGAVCFVLMGLATECHSQGCVKSIIVIANGIKQPHSCLIHMSENTWHNHTECEWGAWLLILLNMLVILVEFFACNQLTEM